MKFTLFVASMLLVFPSLSRAEDWLQLQGNARRSGDATDTTLPSQLGLIKAIQLSDGIYTSPVVAEGMIYVIDGSGIVYAIDDATHAIQWSFTTKGGLGNCNNVSSPAIIGDFLHVGTMAGYYYVLARKTGEVVKQIDCQEAIFASPVVSRDRAYFATLGAQVYALSANGEIQWTWDFVREIIGFDGDRWKGDDWLKARPQRVTWRDHFVCSREICLIDETLVIPAGGRTVFLEDRGDSARLRIAAEVPEFDGKEFPATFGQSADSDGRVYVQWHRRDNAGRVEVFQLNNDDQIQTSFLAATKTAIQLPGLLSVSSVACASNEVYRTRPEAGFGLCRYTLDQETSETLCDAPSIASPTVTREHILYGGLDGRLHVVHRRDGSHKSLRTGFDSPISASVAIANEKIYLSSEDGHLYIFGRDGHAPLPSNKLDIHRIRSPLQGELADAKFNWFTNYGDFSCTNANDQGLRPPLRMRWARRIEGTVKHLPVCGGGRVYTHTAEGQIIACEQDTGRVLWRRYFPDVFLSFTSPLYIDEKLIVPQAGMKQSRMRCLDAATGNVLWEAPFTGSPSWSRQFPPVVHGDIAIYASGSGDYAHQGTEKPFIFKGTPSPSDDGKEVMSWIYSNDNPYYPLDNRPLLWAWNIQTGELVWKKDFSEFGRGGNDCGLCLMNGKLFYSTFFGYSSSQLERRGLSAANHGLTACMNPLTGETLWHTTDYYVTAKCTLSGRDGCLYLGGNNRPNETTNDRFVWCLDAETGKLLWQSDPITSALNVVSVGANFIFSNALRGRGNVFDRQTGKVVSGVDHNYACCRFTLSEPYILGANMDMIDLSRDSQLVSTGPAIDSRECLGAVVSNGRVFYTSQASGFMVSQTYGDEAETKPAVWASRSRSAKQ